ncbi:hypothetical protein SAMN05660916_03075 [Arthrobacter sp. 31Cvi3.1E]|nr:hypothetical protein [Paenarthrobacter nicotinovorans]SKB87046.1 hypothetical protein SAMN05660916_03075 [Arthrobacter sp. 31Cvi3.1E]
MTCSKESRIPAPENKTVQSVSLPFRTCAVIAL